MITTTRTGDRTTITIDRPNKANALSREMLVALRDAVIDAADAKVLVITGTGKVFSAGADLREAAEGLAVDTIWEEVSGAIAAHTGLTIAALNGTSAGGSLGIILACDMRIAVPTAKVFYPVMKLGFLPQPSDPMRMGALIGPARTKMILMGGQKIPADQAYDFGLIDVITDDLEATIGTLTPDVLAATHDHISGIKSLCQTP